MSMWRRHRTAKVSEKRPSEPGTGQHGSARAEAATSRDSAAEQGAALQKPRTLSEKELKGAKGGKREQRGASAEPQSIAERLRRPRRGASLPGWGPARAPSPAAPERRFFLRRLTLTPHRRTELRHLGVGHEVPSGAASARG